MPFLLFLRKIPWQAWALLGILIAFALLRSHWIGVGVKRCEAKQEAAQAQADKEAAKQEAEAPKVAEEAKEAIQPTIEERVIYVNKNNSVGCDAAYSTELQDAIREASAAVNNVRQPASPDSGKADD